mmetsp:Transcript_43347/g.101141  ORF Transcript_43347/g.101141 Transcript_43347/m.101141 type:complete len:162 (+) Transcript_43347:145-630(+)
MWSSGVAIVTSSCAEADPSRPDYPCWSSFLYGTSCHGSHAAGGAGCKPGRRTGAHAHRRPFEPVDERAEDGGCDWDWDWVCIGPGGGGQLDSSGCSREGGGSIPGPAGTAGSPCKPGGDEFVLPTNAGRPAADFERHQRDPADEAFIRHFRFHSRWCQLID